MILYVVSWQLQGAELAEGRQFRHSILHGKISSAGVLADLASAVGACRCLVLEARIGKKVVEASTAHKVPICALKQLDPTYVMDQRLSIAELASTSDVHL